MPANGRLRITKISLTNWRNFLHANVDLAGRAFLVGPNASGKSNFLDAIEFLHDVVSVGGGFEDAVMKRGGVSPLRCFAARRETDITLRVDLGTDREPKRWQYQLSFNQRSKRGPEPILKQELVIHNGTTDFERPDRDDKSDPDRLTQTFLEQVNVNRRFREVAAFLRSVRYLHIVPQLVREPERSVGKHDDPYGGDFITQIADTAANTRKARLRRIQEALQVAVPQLKELKLEQDEKGVFHLMGRYKHWRPRGAWQSERDFSDGTLRLMGLLWAVLDGDGPLLLEEPELSLHPEVVRYIPQMLARIESQLARQILVSTHSPEILQDEGIGMDEVLLLVPESEGTSVRPASEYEEIQALLDGGLSMADAVIPRTRPGEVEQLSLFPRR